MTTPGIPSPSRPCRVCAQPTTLPGQRCEKHKAEKAQQHNTRTAYYRSTEWRALAAQCKSDAYNQCCLCSSTERLAAHHVRARKNGGEDSLTNLICACHRCHSRIEAGRVDTLELLAEYLRLRPT